MEDLLSISQMACLHGITRQTLIYYDDIGLFRPIRVDENGYRYYSKKQIPFLREICFLKNLGIGLKEILLHFEDRTPSKEIELLGMQKKLLTEKIGALNRMREAIKLRLSLYEDAIDADETQFFEPFVKHYRGLRAVFKEYIQPIGRENLHLTMMDIWNEVYKQGSIPSCGFGSIFRKESILSGNPDDGAGSCVFLYPWSEYEGTVIDMPAGEYACMYKYGMPYDTDKLKELVRWIDSNGYELCGDMIDICLLDTTFYNSRSNTDFGLLQAPVRKKK